MFYGQDEIKNASSTPSDHIAAHIVHLCKNIAKNNPIQEN